MIDLFVLVIPARGPDRQPDPIFFVSGGPGGAATQDALGVRDQFRAANLRRDLVFVDQRGTGASNELVCPFPSDYDREELRGCLADLSGDPRAYTTAWAMDDLDQVRAALGYDTINLYGGSYGATAAQVYLQRHPARVRTAIMAAGPLLGVPMYEWYPRSSQRALDQVFARCAEDPRCRAAYPDPRADLAAVTAALDRAPVDLPPTGPGTGGPVRLTPEAFRAGVHGLLFDTRTAPVLPALLRAAAEQDWEAVARIVAPLAELEQDSIQAMRLTMGCHEPWAGLRRAATEALSVGSYLTYPDIYAMLALEVCALVPRPPAAALYSDPIPVSVPVLAIHGESDPQDPPELMVSMGDHYPDSRLLVARGQAHANWSLPAGCLESIIDTFVTSASVAAVDAGCLERAAALPFRLP